MKQRPEAALRRKSETALPELRVAVPPDAESENEPESKPSSFASFRELAETLAIALFLSILFKFFEAEAYVIPTGSMAPTLMGRHKDVNCTQCGFPFQVSASEEMDNDTNRSSGIRTEAGTCPQCGFTQYFPAEVPSFAGDRVLVNKCVSEYRDTQRWDVSVFRCPADPKNNYIKRIIGLPNEKLRIQYGDIFVQKVSPEGKELPFEIMRKPLANLLQMLQVVYDNDYPPKPLLEAGWPSRWSDDRTAAGEGESGWIPTDDGRGFYCAGRPVPTPPELQRPTAKTAAEAPQPQSASDEQNFEWLRYRHIVPSSEDWLYFSSGKLPPSLENSGKIRNNPQLITDQTAYNTGISQNSGTTAGNRFAYYVRESQNGTFCLKSPDGFGFNWIGDLAVSCDVALGEFAPNDNAELLLELVKGGTVFRARLELSAGAVSLEIPSVADWRPERVACAFPSGGRVRVTFMNIDEQMRLLIDGQEVEFPGGGKYDHLCQNLPNGMPGALPRNRDPNALDLTPVAVGIKGAPAEIRRLKIQRDIYYIAMGRHLEPVEKILSRAGGGERQLSGSYNRRCDRLFAEPVNMSDENAYTAFLSDPAAWKDYGNTRSCLFETGGDQFLAFGDNSGLSLDSRLWETDDIPYYVDKRLLLGKAICVYWPHGKLIPGTSLPYLPNFSKMRPID